MANSKSIKPDFFEIFVKTILGCSLLLLLVFIFAKYVRQILPPPQILDNKIVGFAQYFGYPLYFDFLLFIIILFLPILTFYIFYFLAFKNEKN